MTMLANDLTVDDALGDRLRRVGHAIDTAPPVAPSPMEVHRPRKRGWMRGAVVAVLAGSTLGGVLLVAGPSSDDPVVGVLPRGVGVDQIESIVPYPRRPGEAARDASLVTVDGIDAVLTSYVGAPENDLGDEDERTVEGIRVRTSIQNYPVVNSRALVRWRLKDGRNYVAMLAKGSFTLEPSVDRLIAYSRRPASSGPTRGVRLVVSWQDPPDYLGLFVRIKGSPRRNVGSQVSAIPARFLPRVDEVVRPWSEERFRYGDFVVTAGVADRKVRPLRRSELHSLVKRIDRRESSRVAPTSWVQLGDGFEAGWSSEIYCVRSENDVACGPYQLDRLVDNTWVRVAFRDTETIRVEGQAVTGYKADGAPKITVFLFPKGAEVAEVTSGPTDSPFSYEVVRPEI